MVFNLFRDTKESIQSNLGESAEKYNLIDRVRKLESWMNQREPDIKGLLHNIKVQQEDLQKQQNSLSNIVQSIQNQQATLETTVKDVSRNQDNINVSLNNAQIAFNKSKESWDTAYQSSIDAKSALNKAELVNTLATDAQNKALEATESAKSAYSQSTIAMNNAQTAWNTAKKTWDTSMKFFEQSFKDIRDKSLKLAEGFNGLGNIFVNEANAIYGKSREVISAGVLKEWNVVGIKFTTMKTPFAFVGKLISSIVQNFTSFGNVRDGMQIVEGNSYELYQVFEQNYKEITELMGNIYVSVIPSLRTTGKLTEEEPAVITTDVYTEETPTEIPDYSHEPESGPVQVEEVYVAPTPPPPPPPAPTPTPTPSVNDPYVPGPQQLF